MPDVPRAWSDQHARTWLANRDVVSEYDRWVRARFAVHRDAAPGAEEALSPWSVAILVGAVGRFTAPDQRQWLWAVAAMANLAELLFCAEDGGIKPSRSIDSGGDDLGDDVRRLRTVRNVCFHPAFQWHEGTGKPHMLGLIEELENDDRAETRLLADRLKGDWAHFATQPVASFTLRTLNSAGALYARSLRDRGLAFQSDDSRKAVERFLGSWRRGS